MILEKHTFTHTFLTGNEMNNIESISYSTSTIYIFFTCFHHHSLSGFLFCSIMIRIPNSGSKENELHTSDAFYHSFFLPFSWIKYGARKKCWKNISIDVLEKKKFNKVCTREIDTGKLRMPNWKTAMKKKSFFFTNACVSKREERSWKNTEEAWNAYRKHNVKVKSVCVCVWIAAVDVPW